MKNKKETLAIALALTIFAALLITACGEPCDHVPGPEATCTVPQKCTLCDKTLKKALSHEWGGWSVLTAALVGQDGEEKRTCSRCDDVQTQPIPALPFTPGLSYRLINSDTEYEVLMGDAAGPNIVIPEIHLGLPVTAIAIDGFRGETAITSVTIPDSVTKIGNNAFRQCSNLETVVIGNGVIDIEDYAFALCTNLISVEFGDNVKNIKYAAFQACYNLPTINIPDGVKSIGGHAFNNCLAVNRIKIPASVNSIGDNAFHGWIVPQVIQFLHPEIDFNIGITSVDSAVGGNSNNWKNICSAYIEDSGGNPVS